MKESSNTITTDNNIDIDTDTDMDTKEEAEAEIREEEIEVLDVALVDVDNDIIETQQTIENTPIGAALREAQEDMVTEQKLQRNIVNCLREEKK